MVRPALCPLKNGGTVRWQMITTSAAHTRSKVVYGPGVFEESQSDRLLFLEILHLLVESSALCGLLEEAVAQVPDGAIPRGEADIPPESHTGNSTSQHDASR